MPLLVEELGRVVDAFQNIGHVVHTPEPAPEPELELERAAELGLGHELAAGLAGPELELAPEAAVPAAVSSRHHPTNSRYSSDSS